MELIGTYALNGLEFIGVSFLVIFSHEALHWIPAKIFSLQPTVSFRQFWAPSVSYLNTGSYGKILVTSALPAFLLVIVGFILPAGYLVLWYMKALCVANIFNILPFTTDGKVILLSLAHLSGIDFSIPESKEIVTSDN